MPRKEEDYGSLQLPGEAVPRPARKPAVPPPPPVNPRHVPPAPPPPVAQAPPPAPTPPVREKEPPVSKMEAKSQVATKSAAQVARRCPLSAEATALLTDTLTARKYLTHLIDNELYHDAVRFLAYALPKREAVWWGCLCVRHALEQNATKEGAAALDAAEKWVKDPTEEHRRAARGAAEPAGFDHPAGCIALGAFCTGNLAEPNAPVKPAEDHLTGQGVAGAVLLAAVWNGAGLARRHYRDFLTHGIDLANGARRWLTGTSQK